MGFYSLTLLDNPDFIEQLNRKLNQEIMFNVIHWINILYVFINNAKFILLESIQYKYHFWEIIVNMNHSDLIHIVYKDIKNIWSFLLNTVKGANSYFSYFFSVKWWEVERKKKWTTILWSKFSANMNYSNSIRNEQLFRRFLLPHPHLLPSPIPAHHESSFSVSAILD